MDVVRSCSITAGTTAPYSEQHARRISADSDKENTSIRVNESSSETSYSACLCSKSSAACSKCIVPKACIACLEKFESTIAKCKEPPKASEKQQTKAQKARRELAPLNISISVIDDNNLNVCMCSYNNDLEPQVEIADSGNRICGRCQNIINQQPVEHRKALISQRLTMANDIIVNRIDSQFLNTYNNSGQKVNLEPYTPDSMESHSPFVSNEQILGSSSSSSSFTKKSSEPSKSDNFDQIETDILDDDNEDAIVISKKEKEEFLKSDKVENNKNIDPNLEQRAYSKNQKLLKNGGGGVNAFQLKSRLEKLQILNRMNKNATKKRYIHNAEDEVNELAKNRRMRKLKTKQSSRFPRCCCCCYQSAELDIEANSSLTSSKSACSLM